ncbi:MAG: OmpA family protein [Chitinivibrionia bacterium]|nr:OmpA family protein [Chitinivibrionia bacterium]
MRKIWAAALAVMILVSTAVAGPDPDETRNISRFGHVGVWNTLSAQTLGYGRLALNVYANHSLDKDFIKNVYRWESLRVPTSTLHFDPDWDYVDARPSITTFNFSIAYGLTRFLDLGVMLPLYIDNIGDGFTFPNFSRAGLNWDWPGRGDDPLAWVGDGFWTQTGIGDLEVSLKFRYPPVQRNNFFQMAYYGALTVPTGVANHGWFPRGTQFLDQRMGAAYMYAGADNPYTADLRSNTGAYNNFTSGSPEVDMKMLWTWDFREMSDNFPVLFHINYGLRWITQHRNDHVFYLNSALEVRPTYWLSLFADFSAAPRFGSIAREESFALWGQGEPNELRPGTYTIQPTAADQYYRGRGLLDDPIRISPGFAIMTPPGITVSMGFDISLAHEYGVFIGDRQTSQTGMTRNNDGTLEASGTPSSILMETGVEPKLRFVASLGWNGLTIPSLPIMAPIEAPRPRDTITVRDTVFLERLIIDTLVVEVDRPVVPTPTFTINASVAAGQGTITPMGINEVREGRLVVYNIAPAQGFSIGQVLVDGINVGAVMQHTFPSVSQNHTISVIFNQDPIEIPVEAPVAFEIPREGLVLRGVNFRIGSAELLPESFSALDQVVRSLRDWPEVRLEIQGHTSAEGVRSARRIQNNLRLSRERAYSVMQYFIQQGIPATQLRAVGMGEEFPIASNDTQAGREMNRRVTLVRIDD